MIYTDKEITKQVLLDVAGKMIAAARTAPKAKGINNIELSVVDGENLKQIADRMMEIGESMNIPAFIRDAKNILDTSVILMLGTRIGSIGLIKCGMCGFENCTEKDKYPDHPCVHNTGDLGIAIGSAVSIAMDHRIDNRIMYTAGQAILDLGLMGNDVKIAYGIPLSISSKNIYFDRK